MSSSKRYLLQADSFARILAEPYFDDIAVVRIRVGMTEQEVKQLVSVRTARGGKVGACILVHIPAADVIDPNLPGPAMGLEQTFTVLVHPELNNSSIGTTKEAEDIAERLLQLFHHVALTGGAVLVGGQNAILPIDAPAGFIGQEVSLSTRGGATAPTKVARPTIASAPAVGPATGHDVTLACATSGAAIKYSIDGSYPTLAYTVPFNVPAASLPATLRTAATKAAHMQSDVAQANLS